MTRRLLTLAAAAGFLLLAACEPNADGTPEPDRIRTIEQEHLPDTRLSGDVDRDQTTSDTSDHVELPFEPPISMDPVDGSKVSIRKTTPTAEHGGRIYHFSSEENRTLFLADPDKYLTGTLATY